jgi:hypothetical protein
LRVYKEVLYLGVATTPHPVNCNVAKISTMQNTRENSSKNISTH